LILNQKTETFYYTRRITSMLVTSLRCPSPRHSQHSYSRRCWSGGGPFATLCKI